MCKQSKYVFASFCVKFCFVEISTFENCLSNKSRKFLSLPLESHYFVSFSAIKKTRLRKKTRLLYFRSEGFVVIQAPTNES